MRMRTLLPLAACLVLLPALAMAEETEQSKRERPYIQFGAGGGVGADDNFFTLKLAGGVALNKTIGLEAGYTTIGDIFFADVDIYYLSAVARYPIGNATAIAGKLGIAKWNTEFSVFSLQSGDDSGTNAMFGVDLVFDVLNNLGIVLSLEHYGSMNVGRSTGDESILSGTLNIRYTF